MLVCKSLPISLKINIHNIAYFQTLAWVSLYKNLKTQLNQLQPLKKALVNRKILIVDYRENLSLIEQYKQYLFSYNHLIIEKKIEEIEQKNQEISDKIKEINMKICDYHTGIIMFIILSRCKNIIHSR